MRDFEKNPYTKEEQRIATFLNDLIGIGGGDDPIGFMLASYFELINLLHQKPDQQ